MSYIRKTNIYIHFLRKHLFTRIINSIRCYESANLYILPDKNGGIKSFKVDRDVIRNV